MARVSVEVVHDMIRAGNDTVEEIVELSGWPRVNIEGAVRQLNMVIDGDDKPMKRTTPAPAKPARPLPQHVVERDHGDDAGDRALDDALDRIHRDDEQQLDRERSLPREEPAPASAVTLTSQHGRPGPLVSAPTPLELLIEKAAQSPVAATRRLGEKIDGLCADLTERLRDEAKRDLEERAKREAAAKAKAEVERLQRQLAEAKARLRPTARTGHAKKAAAAPASEASKIREWAAQNGHQVNGVGRVPAEVKAAYYAAQGSAAAS